MSPFHHSGRPAAVVPVGRRRIGAAILGAALFLFGMRPAFAAPGRAAAQVPLTVSTPEQALGAAMRAAFFAPFAVQSGVAVDDNTWDGRLSTLEDRARDGAPAIATLLLMDDVSVLAACQEGLLLPLDPASIPGLDPSGRGGRVSRCGIGALRTGLVLAWDRSRVDGVPNWSDFWDVARRPGKRGLGRDPRGTLEIALLADGVAPDEVYRVLGTAAGLDRAFHKLDQLKPYLVWWNTPAEAVQLIEAGAVLMTSAPDGVVAVADQAGHRDFGVQWRGSLSTMLSWAMPGRPAPDGAAPPPDGTTDEAHRRALQLLGFTLDPVRQAAFLSGFPAAGVGGAGSGGDGRADAGMGAAAAGTDPPAAGDGEAERARHLDGALKQDDAFWAAHLDAVRARFDSWIGG